MFVKIGKDKSVTLEDTSNFKQFHVDCDHPADDFSSLSSTFASFGQNFDKDHIWVLEQWIRRQVGDPTPDWNLGFGKMLDFARKQGWINESPLAIRAHINWK